MWRPSVTEHRTHLRPLFQVCVPWKGLFFSSVVRPLGVVLPFPLLCLGLLLCALTDNLLSLGRGAGAGAPLLRSRFSLFLSSFSQLVTASISVLPSTIYPVTLSLFLSHRCFLQLLMGRLKWRLKYARGRERWLVTTNFLASSHWYVGSSAFLTLDLTFLEKFKAFSISVDP